MKNKLLTTAVVITFFFAFRVNAQDAVIKMDSLYSDILKEERPLEILFPENYKPDMPAGYDILYITDGISDILQHEWQWAQGQGFIPENMIIVGIPDTFHNGNNMRNRDFTPTKQMVYQAAHKIFSPF